MKVDGTAIDGDGVFVACTWLQWSGCQDSSKGLVLPGLDSGSLPAVGWIVLRPVVGFHLCRFTGLQPEGGFPHLRTAHHGTGPEEGVCLQWKRGGRREESGEKEKQAVEITHT